MHPRLGFDWIRRELTAPPDKAEPSGPPVGLSYPPPPETYAPANSQCLVEALDDSCWTV